MMNQQNFVEIMAQSIFEIERKIGRHPKMDSEKAGYAWQKAYANLQCTNPDLFHWYWHLCNDANYAKDNDAYVKALDIMEDTDNQIQYRFEELLADIEE
jgi:hypothetical protein